MCNFFRTSLLYIHINLLIIIGLIILIVAREMKFIIFDDEKTAVEISKIVEHMQHTILQ